MSSLLFVSTFVDTYLRGRDIEPARVGILLPILGIVVSEAFLFFGYIWPALWGHFVTLLLSTLAQLYVDEEAPLFQAFALVPVFRLVNLGMPVFFHLTVYWFPLIYGPLLPAVYIIGRANDSVSLSLRWKQTTLALPLILPMSAFLGTVEYRIIAPQALIPTWSLANLAVLSIVMIGFVGFVEELLFRGVLQRTLIERIGRIPGVLLTSGLFGLMHSGYHVPAELLFAGSLGFIFGLVYEITDSIGIVTVVHGILNTFLFGVIPMRNNVPALAPSIERMLRLLGA